MEQLSAGLRFEDIDFDSAEPISDKELKDLFGEAPQAQTAAGIRRMPYVALAAAAVFVLLVLTAGFLSRMRVSKNYTVMTISINPSIELLLDGTEVKKITAKNKDADPVVAGIDRKLGLEKVLYTIILRLDEGGYFDKDESTLDIDIEGPDEELIEETVDRQMIKTIRENNIHTSVLINSRSVESELSVESETDREYAETEPSFNQPTEQTENEKTETEIAKTKKQETVEEVMTTEDTLRADDSSETEAAVEEQKETTASVLAETEEKTSSPDEQETNDSVQNKKSEEKDENVTKEDTTKKSKSDKEKKKKENKKSKENKKNKKKTEEKKSKGEKETKAAEKKSKEEKETKAEKAKGKNKK